MAASDFYGEGWIEEVIPPLQKRMDEDFAHILGGATQADTAVNDLASTDLADSEDVANPPESLADFRNNTEPLSTETLQYELEALHAQLLHIGPRLHIIRSILQGRKNHDGGL